jgi:hypothetical protein
LLFTAAFMLVHQSPFRHGGMAMAIANELEDGG